MNERRITEAFLEITEKPDEPFCFSVKINGVEISNDLASLEYSILPGKLPVVKLGFYTSGVGISTGAFLDLPENLMNGLELREKEIRPKQEDAAAHSAISCS